MHAKCVETLITTLSAENWQKQSLAWNLHVHLRLSGGHTLSCPAFDNVEL
jgi:hypothetical protein